jgi:hypothetical protein
VAQMKKKTSSFIVLALLTAISACDSGGSASDPGSNGSHRGAPIAPEPLPSDVDSISKLLGSESATQVGGWWYARAEVDASDLIGAAFERAVMSGQQQALASIMATACGSTSEQAGSFSWRFDGGMRYWLDDLSTPPVVYIAVDTKNLTTSCG